MLDKTTLPDRIVTARTVVRKTITQDLPHMRRWPAYPWPYRKYSMTAPEARSADGRFWWEKIDGSDRCFYSVVLSNTGEVVGLHALFRIDWSSRIVGNMEISIRADLCNQGHGTESLRALLAELF